MIETWKEQCSDITPLKIEEEEEGMDVLSIDYTGEYKETMGYFYALRKKKEYSMRGYNVAIEALNLNSRNYTVWGYIRNYLRFIICSRDATLKRKMATSSNLDTFLTNVSFKGTTMSTVLIELCKTEIARVQEMIMDGSQKNYQIWHHLQMVWEMVSMNQDEATNELVFVDKIFKEDAKNYHAWQYRVWVIQTSKIYNEEPIMTLLKEDGRNNSAWNHLHWLCLEQPEDWVNDQQWKTIIQLAAETAIKMPHNEAPWQFLIALMQHQALYLKKRNQFKTLLIEASKLIQEGNTATGLRLYSIAYFDTEAAYLKNEPSEESLTMLNTTKTRLIQQCITMDPIREKYWSYVLAKQSPFYE